MKIDKLLTIDERKILQGSSIAHFLIDRNHTIVAWNPACEALTGFSARQMIGTSNQWKPFYNNPRPCLCDLLVDKASYHTIKRHYKGMQIKRWGLIRGAYEIEGFFSEMHKKGKWLRFTAAPLLNKKGDIIGAIETLEDITERKQAEEKTKALNRKLIVTNRKLRMVALRDMLTGLFNQRYLEEVLEAEFLRAKRYGQALSIIMLDIDYFKSINERYGRKFGDQVLVQLAVFLKKIVRKYDILVRYGGEEFIIISPGSNFYQTSVLARRIMDEINLYSFGDTRHSLKLKLSMAVVCLPDDKIVNSEDLLRIGEELLLKAKEAGGNRIFSNQDKKQQILSTKQKRKQKETIESLRYQLQQITRRANQNLMEAIFAFAKAIELRDHYTGEHVEQTVYYATQIGRMLKLSEEEIENIRQAAVLHDLGKIGISDNILLKKGKLSEEEYLQIKKHPEIAADILRPIHFLRSVIPYILYHHERWDGKGYPSGLKGQLIPVGARIIALADVFQALTSNRPYRKAFTKEEAIRIIKQGSGKQFDPKIVRAFLALIKKKNIHSVK